MPKRTRVGDPVVKGGNGEVALRMAKGNRYGRDTYKVRCPSKFHYQLRLLTFTTAQGIDYMSPYHYTPIPLTPSANNPPQSNLPGFNLLPQGSGYDNPNGANVEMYYRHLGGDRTGTGLNGVVSMNAQGLFWHWGEELPSGRSPWLTTFFAFKLDQKGFNICDPIQFAENCKKFMYVKQGPACATFVFPDMPIDQNNAVTRQYTLMNPTAVAAQDGTVAGDLGSISGQSNEFRGLGPYEMIIIPPRKMKSINTGNLTSDASWNKLIQMGFKPRPCQRVTKIYCSNSGLDASCGFTALAKVVNQTTTRTSNIITANEIAAPGRDYNPAISTSVGVYNSSMSLTSLRWKKHSYTDTEDVCQWTGVASPNSGPQPNAPRTEMKTTEYDTLDVYFSQGYDCIPFGSAIVFKIRQYAPPNLRVDVMTGQMNMFQTCVRQTIPLDIYLDSVTTFKGPVEGRFDLDLPYSNPSVVPINTA